MKQSIVKDPIAAFALPPHPPEAVAEAQARFNTLGEKWAKAKDDLREAKAAVRAAKAEDVRAAAETYAAGKTPRDSTKREDAARVRVRKLEAELESLGLALDEAGNELARAVPASTEEWIAALEEIEQRETESFLEAIREAEAALERLRPARSGIAWLRAFDPNRRLSATSLSSAAGGSSLRVRTSVSSVVSTGLRTCSSSRPRCRSRRSPRPGS